MLAYWRVASVLLQFCILNGVSGDFTVSLAVFSGVPDPEWTLTSNDPNYNEIVTRVAAAIQNNLAYYPENIPAILGYKGFLVAPISSKKKAEVQGLTEERLIVGPKTEKLQMLLFKTMPKGVLPDDLSKEISQDIASGSVKPQVAGRRTKRYAPPFDDAPWRTRNRQLNNNCYNYATTIPTNTYAQPGRATGQQLHPPITFNNVRDSAVSDGLAVLNVAPTAQAPGNPPNENHVVALVIWRYEDFHWYRLDDDGTWSHKPGKAPITQDDNNGAVIHDPRVADLNRY